jgi:hypothetical protein
MTGVRKKESAQTNLSELIPKLTLCGRQRFYHLRHIVCSHIKAGLMTPTIPGAHYLQCTGPIDLDNSIAS